MLSFFAGQPFDQLDAIGLVGRVLCQQHAREIDVGAAPSKVGRITLVASAHGFFSGSLFIINAQ